MVNLPYSKYSEPKDEEPDLTHMLIQIGYLLLRVVLALMTAEGCLQAVNYVRVKGSSPDEERLNSTLHKLFGFGPKLIEHPGW